MYGEKKYSLVGGVKYIGNTGILKLLYDYTWKVMKPAVNFPSLKFILIHVKLLRESRYPSYYIYELYAFTLHFTWTFINELAGIKVSFSSYFFVRLHQKNCCSMNEQ